MRILNAGQMREAERVVIEDIGLPSIVLMENAGRQVVSAIEAGFSAALDGRVAVLCGRGNNGGDGFVVARTLLERGVDAAVWVIGALADVRGDARINLDVLGRLGASVVEVADEQQWELHFSEMSRCTLIVDALFGTGLRAPLQGMLETVVADINASELPVVSIDLPSGLSADTPQFIGDCIDATMTVTLTAPKLPLVLPPAEGCAGDVVVAQIGVPIEVVEATEGPRIELLTPEQVRTLIPPRAADSHKGDYGRVTIVGGGTGKTGAAYLAAMGALRSGAGLVTVAAPAASVPILASMAPEFMTEALTAESSEDAGLAAARQVLDLRHDVIACGPGLGVHAGAHALVRELLSRSEVPLVLDADALTVLGAKPDCLTGRDDRPVVITPHPGEMARLLGVSVDDVQARRLEAAAEFATTRQIFVVLKGHRSLIATPDGRLVINPTGGPGLATGGTGDVLTGILAAWLAQLLDPEAACRLAVFLHGAAGDAAESAVGQVPMTATSVVAHIGPAIAQLLNPQPASVS